MMSETVNNDAKLGVKLPSDSSQVKVVAKYDILKYLRSRRLLGMLVIEALVLILITAVLATSNRTYTADAVVGQYTSFVNILIILGATLFGGDAIVSEFQGRTGYLLFPNPVKKVSILAGKFLSSLAAMGLMLVIYYAVAIAAGLAIGNGLSTLAFASLGLAMLYGVAALSVAYLISSVMKGSTGALILTFAMFLFIFNIITSLVGQLGGIKPWFMVDFAGSSLSHVMVSPYPMDSVQTVGVGSGQSLTIYSFYPDIGVSIAVMVAYAVVALLLAYVFFKRREMSA
jgi:ABC-2 type transport system permease protein